MLSRDLIFLSESAGSSVINRSDDNRNSHFEAEPRAQDREG